MIILQNKGLIDLDLIKTMGVNIKEGEDTIGYFGTGLKYAIAIFLREGIEFCLYIGANKYEFYTEKKTIRGKEFDICCMSGPHDAIELNFTTELGKNWEVWQAYREIESNCRDEGGIVHHGASSVGPRDDLTTFCIENIAVGDVFVDNTGKPLLHKDGYIEIYEGESDVIYYRGIKAKILDRPSLYTYNLLGNCTLTEDRLICYDHHVQYQINTSISGMDDEKLIKEVATASKEYFESSLRFDEYNYRCLPGDAFMNVCASSSKVNHGAREFYKSSLPKTPQTDKDRIKKAVTELKSICDDYGLKIKYNENGLVITGDLLRFLN